MILIMEVQPSFSQFLQQNSGMEVVELARTAVNTLNKLANWGQYSNQPGVGPKEGDELMDFLAKIDGRLVRVARKRAKASGRNLEEVFAETKLEFYFNEAKFMETEMLVDPREEVVKVARAVTEADKGEVCGVCQEEVEEGEVVVTTACMHTFHGLCLWTWLDGRKTCPLCRFTVLQ